MLLWGNHCRNNITRCSSNEVNCPVGWKGATEGQGSTKHSKKNMNYWFFMTIWTGTWYSWQDLTKQNTLLVGSTPMLIKYRIIDIERERQDCTNNQTEATPWHGCCYPLPTNNLTIRKLQKKSHCWQSSNTREMFTLMDDCVQMNRDNMMILQCKNYCPHYQPYEFKEATGPGYYDHDVHILIEDNNTI